MRKIILKSTSPPKYSPDHQVGHVFMYNKVAVMILLDGPAPEKWQVLQSLSKVARLITKLYLGSRKHCFTSIALQYQIVSQAIVPQQSYTGASLPGGLAARWPWEAKGEKKPVATTVALSQRDLFFLNINLSGLISDMDTKPSHGCEGGGLTPVPCRSPYSDYQCCSSQVTCS